MALPTAPDREAADLPRESTSLLYGDRTGQATAAGQGDLTFASDLRLDQAVGAIAGDREERELVTGLLYQQVRDIDTLLYRHEIFRDLQDPGLFGRARHFAEQMRQVRAHLGQLARMTSRHQREGWFLDAAAIYCGAVRSVADDLACARITSRGLLAVRDYLAAYVDSPEFAGLVCDTKARKDDLGQVRYLVRVRGMRVDVSRYDGEADYSNEIHQAFERFQQGAAKNYRLWPGMNHVGAQYTGRPPRPAHPCGPGSGRSRTRSRRKASEITGPAGPVRALAGRALPRAGSARRARWGCPRDPR
jgi:DNA mismatch repair protein MutS